MTCITVGDGWQTCVGYDPYFNAGPATGIAANPVAKVPALVLALTGSLLTATQVWKLYAFLASCLAGLWEGDAHGSRMYLLLALAPVSLRDDPNPFIRIDNPPPELTIYFD